MKRKINITINLTPSQITILKKINDAGEDGYEGGYEDHEYDDFQKLCEIGAVDTIMGEQFYITDIGKKYLAAI